MRIFLPYESKSLGGPSSFAAKFISGMKQRGHSVFLTPSAEYDVLLLIVQTPVKYLLEAKLKGKLIVQRLDGVYYWTVSGWKFPWLNLKAALIRHLFADVTVYQSRYSRDCCNQFLFPKPGGKYSIIYNGVDTKVFSPAGAKKQLRDRPGQQIFFSASVYRRPDQIMPILEALKIYSQKYTANFKFLVAGPFLPAVAQIPRSYSQMKNVIFLGPVNNADLPQYARAADVFLITHLNPPCPNNVLEAMACGLPVCGVGDGAMPELIDHRKDGLLLPADGSAFWRTRQYDLDQYATNLAYAIAHRDQLSKNSLAKTRAHFTLVNMLDQYEASFNNSI